MSVLTLTVAARSTNLKNQMRRAKKAKAAKGLKIFAFAAFAFFARQLLSISTAAKFCA
jgi:hypothetical protein